MNDFRVCFGRVMHRRLRPAAHVFYYPVFYFRVRLQALEQVSQAMFSVNRFNLFSLHFADHGARDGSAPLPWIRALLAREGIDADGDVWLQAFPRVLGYVFNPVSFWYCHGRDGGLKAVLAEVNNTFGEHHNYLLVSPDGGDIRDGQTLLARKVFHVSPFMAVQGFYRFRFHSGQEGTRNLVRIEHADDAGDLLHTAVSGDAAPLATRTLLRALFAYPWQSVGVIARIHWQALRLWLKRVPFFSKPLPPLEETTR
jgi:DUF1365 family protein